MDAMDYWRLCDELSIIQAALLILGVDPSGNEDNVLDWEPRYRPEGFDAVFSALKVSVASNLPAKIIHNGETAVWEYEGEITADWVKKDTPDWHRTTIKIEHLKNWLTYRGLKPSFFFPNGTEDRDYLDSNNAYYAPKLAAAVKAWETVTGNPQLLSRKTPKQALEKWLREHATEYGLTKDDGTHNQQGIDQIAKVANWKPEGGAAKTPVAVVANPIPPLKAPANNVFEESDDWEGEIPF